VNSYSADQVLGALDWRSAVSTLRDALGTGLDPEAEPARMHTDFGPGELLTMPSAAGGYAGVKLVTVAPDNPARGLPRIAGVYVLFDAQTLRPLGTMDGAALTALRTPAVSALGLDLIAPSDVARLVVFGTGPQAYGHVHAFRAVRALASVGVVGRNAERSAAFVDRLRAEGVDAELVDPTAVVDADVVACCTTAREPVFDGHRLGGSAVVVACGSHQADAREVDTETMRRCGVVVESVSTALAEAGDVVLAIGEGALAEADLVPLAALVRGQTTRRPRLFKTVGMGWEDLVIAAAVAAAIED
jgi:ornithine cyclodeaminase/alanine dehydrogenase-like protein (mu-crystallin family)